MEEESEVKLVMADNDEVACLLGNEDKNLRIIEKEFPVRIVVRGNEFSLHGKRDQVEMVSRLLAEFTKLVRRGQVLTPGEVRHAARAIRESPDQSASVVFPEVVLVSDRGKQIRPRSAKQKEYVDAIRSLDLVLGVGPAGTGKTYLAMAMAVAAWKDKAVSRIILSRPAVEAGERLGFLPGDLQEKIDPYLRPLYDALFDMMEVERTRRLIERGVIEVAPLAFMRGRTLNDSFIVLDEAQNTTPEQMKMFLTRLGFGSKAVVTGDITQTDLPQGQISGLNQVRELLSGIPGIATVYFSDRDVVRHELVQKIIKAYQGDGESRS